MQQIEIEYNRQLQPLEAVLSGVKQPGDFFVSGTAEIPMPRVEITGVGPLSFPLPKAQIAALVRRAERAPYGKGENTIVDTSVRNVWQIAPSQVEISGKSWGANFENILSTVKAALGCEDAIVSAKFYKLLVYSQGGFFLAHRDTEKTAGMFGTLVVTLPSAYRGGALRITHGTREVTIETDAADPSEVSYAAFYADCEHEVLPVHAGERVCLVYNLVQKRSKGKRGVLKAPEYESQIAEIAALLDRSLKAAEAPAKIAWLLDHQYSPAGLSFSSLKGADAARARVLAQAAVRAQCDCHLGIVHIGESGSAEPDYDPFYRSRRNRYWHDEDEEAEDEENGDEDTSFTVDSVDDSWQYVDEWRDRGDRAVKFGRIPLAAGELLPVGALDREPPDEKRLTEASGNEGATYERSYHRAALVLWRQDRSIDVLLQAGVVAALPYLARLTAGGKRSRPEALGAAERILAAWPADSQRWQTSSLDGEWPGPQDRIRMIAALTKLDEPLLLERFLREVVAPSYDGSENEPLLAAIDVLGDAKATSVFAALASAQMPKHPSECAALLLALSGDPSHCFPDVAAAAVEGIGRIGASKPEADVADWEPEEEEEERRPDVDFLESRLHALPRFNGGFLCRVASEKIISRPEVFNPVTLVVPAIERICAARRQNIALLDDTIRDLWTSAAEFLLRRNETPPEPPSDWRLDVEIKCRCADCVELQAFARDAAARVHRFRVNKQRRRHLHGIIDRHRLDMTHVTERVGSPQTLVCTKDRRTFDRRMKQYGDEIAAMRRLVKLAPKAGTVVLAERVGVAVKRAGEIPQPRRQ
ncbi:MAG TPA: 2OG-Fe(II) oxygenase [Bryobacteraceae bacterium]